MESKLLDDKMKKRALTIGICAILALVLAYNWKTIAFQALLIRSSMKHPQERDCVQTFFNRIVTNDVPTAEWIESLDNWDAISDKTNYFYFLKVHFAECRTGLGHIKRGRIFVSEENPAYVRAEFYYQRHCPCLEVELSKKTTTDWKIKTYFPLNNCFFNPDKNRDGHVDLRDVAIASKKTN